MQDLSFQAFRDAASPQQREAFRSGMEMKGYYAFFAFIEDFREALKNYDETEIREIGDLLSLCLQLFPQPGRFSPSWDRVWQEFEGIYQAKNDAMAEISPSERKGEWQVLIDNPYMHQQVVCYPDLSFTAAAFMYAYFQKDLKPNECLRLQKVTHLLMRNGLKEASIFPDN
jgi:hypothetical protein